LSEDAAVLRNKFSELIARERAKRTEKVLLEALAYAFLAALVLLPLRGTFSRVNPFYYPAAAFVLAAACIFYFRRWRQIDSLRAVAALDGALRLDALAVTAAEVVGKPQVTTAERYLLRDAAERLEGVQVGALFKREWSWPALAGPGLVMVWLALLWLGVGGGSGTRNPASPAEKLKQFAQELEQKSEAQRLAESLKLARTLKALAEERIGRKTTEEQFAQGVAAMEKRLDAPAPAPQSDFDLGGYTREELAALRAELEAAKSRLRAPAGMREREFLDRLQSLPRLGEAMKRAGGTTENMGPGELQKLLDQLDREATDELDQRTRADTQQYLSMLMPGREGGDAPAQARIPGRSVQDPAGDEKSGGKGELPGDQPGKQGERGQAPVANAGAAGRVTGQLGPGASSGMTWRSEAKAGESKIPEQDAPASYRRQMEEDLAAEKIPPALKETVKQYFLSLGAEKK
jgi:hypothetical protein